MQKKTCIISWWSNVYSLDLQLEGLQGWHGCDAPWKWSQGNDDSKSQKIQQKEFDLRVPVARMWLSPITWLLARDKPYSWCSWSSTWGHKRKSSSLRLALISCIIIHRCFYSLCSLGCFLQRSSSSSARSRGLLHFSCGEMCEFRFFSIEEFF